MGDPALWNLTKQVNTLLGPADGGDLDPAAVYLNGPPDYYTTDYTTNPGDAPFLTYADMAAVADPAWLPIFDSLNAVDGTLVWSSANANSVYGTTAYYPVWLLPTSDAEFRVWIDSYEISNIPAVAPGGKYIQPYLILQNSTVDYTAGSMDDGYLGVEFGTGADDGHLWYGHDAVYSDAPGGFQPMPMQSITPQESADATYSAFSVNPMPMPWVAFQLDQPFRAFTSNIVPEDTGYTLTGVRLESA